MGLHESRQLSLLMQEEVFAAAREAVDRNGKTILLDASAFMAAFRDIAPNHKYPSMMFALALNEGIGEYYQDMSHDPVEIYAIKIMPDLCCLYESEVANAVSLVLCYAVRLWEYTPKQLIEAFQNFYERRKGSTPNQYRINCPDDSAKITAQEAECRKKFYGSLAAALQSVLADRRR